jgi:hypothetical protein
VEYADSIVLDPLCGYSIYAYLPPVDGQNNVIELRVFIGPTNGAVNDELGARVHGVINSDKHPRAVGVQRVEVFCFFRRLWRKCPRKILKNREN